MSSHVIWSEKIGQFQCYGGGCDICSQILEIKNSENVLLLRVILYSLINCLFIFYLTPYDRVQKIRKISIYTLFLFKMREIYMLYRCDKQKKKIFVGFMGIRMIKQKAVIPNK